MDTSDTASYLYDGRGRRVKRVNADGTDYSFYDQAGRLIYREKADGKKVSYVFLAKLQVARIEDGLATYIHTDLLGSPVVESDASRTVLEGTRMHYRPFGQTIEAPKDEVGYTGHKFDTDIGLVYAQQRYYDSDIGRFYADEPVGFRDFHSFNRYAYVNNNPYRYIDPDGRSSLALNGARMMIVPAPGARVVGAVMLLGAAVQAISVYNESSQEPATGQDAIDIVKDGKEPTKSKERSGKTTEFMPDITSEEADEVMEEIKGLEGVEVKETENERGSVTVVTTSDGTRVIDRQGGGGIRSIETQSGTDKTKTRVHDKD